MWKKCDNCECIPPGTAPGQILVWNGTEWVPTFASASQVLLLDYNPSLASSITVATGRVSELDDSSGFAFDSNRNVVQGTAGRRPLFTLNDPEFNNHASMLFDGATRDDYLVSGTFAVGLPAATTWMVVAEIDGYDSAALSFIVDGIDGVNREPIYAQAPATISGNGALNALGQYVPTLSKRKVIIVFKAGANGRMYVSDYKPYAAGAAGNNTQAGVTIGAGQGAPATLFFVGKIVRVQAWTELSDSFIQNVLLPSASATYGLPVNNLITAILLGDSITLGSGGNPGGWRKDLFDAHPFWTGRGSFEDPAEYFHHGVPGWKLTDMNANFAGVWAANRGEEIWVSGGTNDIFSGATAATALTRMNTLLTTIFGIIPSSGNVIVRVASIPPLPGFPAEVAAFNAGLPAVVAGFPLANFSDVAAGMTNADIGGDNVHPTVAGYQKMADNWFTSIPAIFRVRNPNGIIGGP
jgi:lysophospholipase L1-like esterase